MPVELALVSHYANGLTNGPSHSLGQDNQIEMEHDLFGHVMSLNSTAGCPMHHQWQHYIL